MIIRDLYDLYERYAADPKKSGQTPPEGMSAEKVFWEIVLSENGELKNILSLSQGGSKNDNEHTVMLVPRPLNERRSSNVRPYFLCDTAEYLFGLGSTEKRNKSRELHENVLKHCDDFVADAVRKFFSQSLPMGQWDVGRLEDILSFKQANNKSNLLVFYVENFAGEGFFAHERPSVIDAWNRYRTENPESSTSGQCSVTSEKAMLARVFLPVTGFAGAQSSGASLISFNCDSFNSYGKTQAYNASVSERVAFGAGTALKMLLSDPERKVHLGDTTFTFWSDRPSPDEDSLLTHFLGGNDGNKVAEDSAIVDRVRNAIEGIKNGRPFSMSFNPDVRYYVLGISPNAARLSVRFFETATLGEVAEHYGQYLRDIEMVGVRETSLFQLIRQCAVQRKYENIPSTLVNPCVQAMLTGGRFPRLLLSTLLSRMRADHGSNNSWDIGQRASLIKACLVRTRRVSGIPSIRESEIDVALNRDNNNVGYLLGRLFAVMERAQSEALGTTNATIRDKYIGSASVTPARVMPTLMHGCQNHLSDLRKKKPGLNVILEKELDEIVGKKLSDNPYPGTLSMEDQGEFFIGYYQERVDLWTSHKQNGSESNETADSRLSEN